MSVIPESQIVLMRKRRLLKQLIASGQWGEVMTLESELFIDMDNAINDPQRSSRELLREMSSLITLYRDLSASCAIQAKQLMSLKGI